uniref:Uncharacterized protein n=1 Tax=Anguilla anguilla TaxID=7936 RepID=A0A0E9T1V5_ANGAN
MEDSGLTSPFSPAFILLLTKSTTSWLLMTFQISITGNDHKVMIFIESLVL